MCLAFPGKIMKIEGLKAFVEYPDKIRPALIGDKSVKVGDYVMVQMGIVIQTVSKSEARKSKEAWTANSLL